MTLSKEDILRELKSGQLEIKREGGELNVEPSSVDLHLGPKFGWYKGQKLPIFVDNENTYPEFIQMNNERQIMIRPKEFLLAHTEEVVTLPDEFVGYLQGRSSVGRLSLFVENAGLVDAGFQGDLTLELFNAGKNTIALKPGMRICQMTLHRHENTPNVGYSEHNGNKYQGQRGPTPSRLYEDFECNGV